MRSEPSDGPLTPLELSAGFPLGTVAAPRHLWTGAVSPLQALEAVIEPALTRSPCLVSFSGGVDSSLILAVALRLARQLGLDEPVPITWRFSSAPKALETDWQERVISELRVREWERIEADHELDLLGPQAQAVLWRHGVLYPPNAHLHAPLIARASPGALLTGFGGDDVLCLGRWAHAARVLVRPRPRTLRDAANVALAISPAPVRRALDPRKDELRLPWLTPAAGSEVARRYAAERASEPMWWRGRLRWQTRRRSLALGLATLDLLAADAGALCLSPLADPRVISALACASPRRGFGSRAEVLAALLGEVAPAAALERRSKASFGEVFWTERSRTFAQEWDGEAVDDTLVDRGALRRFWRGERVDWRTGMLLQQVWLAHERAKAPAVQPIPQPSNDGPA